MILIYMQIYSISNGQFLFKTHSFLRAKNNNKNNRDIDIDII